MRRTVLEPSATRALVPALADTRNPNVWLHRYTHPKGWQLSIATHAEPASDKLSLGGFRIAPEERTSVAGFDADVEAIELAMGMEEKVHWSRIIGVGGPLARRDMSRIVGGKCVLHPTPDARMGCPNDRALLDFAIACLRDCDAAAGIRITTGQDLGHGLMSDGVTQSLDYLHSGFPGSVVADTSKPTGEGNYHVLHGMLRAFGIALREANVGLVGAGNIGMHVAQRIRDAGGRAIAIEPRAERRDALEKMGISAFTPDRKSHVLEQPIDAVVLNASGGSLDTHSVTAIAGNHRVRVICGSENLVMPDPGDADRFLRAHQAYCPTELGGMMGYLTAVEQYLAELERMPFDAGTLMAAAEELEEPAFRATRRMIDSDFTLAFEAAIAAITA